MNMNLIGELTVKMNLLPLGGEGKSVRPTEVTLLRRHGLPLTEATTLAKEFVQLNRLDGQAIRASWTVVEVIHLS